MGFLDHSTNNIIVDAVLTDIGRKKLAEGTFAISKFGLGDDEVDYTVIKKFGRTVGKEKIEKNTPVFEAQTNADLALKHKLVTVSNPYLTKLPYLEISATENVTSAQRGVSAVMTVVQKPNDLFTSTAATGASDVRDTIFTIEYDSRFLSLSSATSTIGNNHIATATVDSTSDASGTNWGGKSLSLSLTVKSFSDSYFSYYSTNASNSVITTYVEITGVFSGQRVVQAINISKSA